MSEREGICIPPATFHRLVMHILKIIHGYPLRYNAGSEVYSQSICNELSQQHRVSIFTREENPFRPDFEVREVHETATRTIYLTNMPRAKDGYRHEQLDRNFGKLVDRLKPDIAHIGHLNHLSTGIVDELVQRSIPIVFTLHDFWLMCPRGQFLQRNFGEADEPYKACEGQEHQKCATTCYSMYFSGKPEDRHRDIRYWTDWIRGRMEETRSLHKKVDLFLAPSRYLMERFLRDFNLPAAQVQYLDYGFPLHYLTTLHAKATEVFTFGYIGTHIPAKGIHHLIEAFSKLQGKALLRIWGRSLAQETAALKQLLQEHVQNGNAVEWMGEYINQNIADAVFRHCDGIVVPSIWGENAPLVIHEAQACRVPVITADFGGMKEYVQHQVNGLLFEHRNPAALAAQMQWALDQPDAFRVLGQRGYLHTPDGGIPEIEVHCRELLSIYQHTIKNHEQRILETHP